LRSRLLLASIAALAVAVLPGVSASAAPQFSDVPTSNQFHNEITWLAEQGISTGYSDGTFRPWQPVSRDAMAAFLYRLAGKPAFTPPSTTPFHDVPTSNPFYREITWLASTGITTGYPDGTFRPYNSVNRDAMAAFMYRYEGSPAFTPPVPGPFRDVPVGTQFAKEIAWLALEGISTGYDEAFGCHAYLPQNAVGRDAMAAFMYRLVNGGSGAVPDGSTCANVPPGTGAIGGNAGTLVVGPQVSPGTYRMSGYSGSGCYYARLSGFGNTAGDIIANAFITTSGAIVTIAPTDVGFESIGCGTWYAVGGPSGMTPRTWIPGNGGNFIVNWEIVPGTYQSSGNNGCYWERSSGFGASVEEIIDNDYVTGGATATVTILSSDTGFISDSCGNWTKIA